MKPIPDFENDATLTKRQKRRRREYYAERELNIQKSSEWHKRNPELSKEQRRRCSKRYREKNKEYFRKHSEQQRMEKPEYFAQYRKTPKFRIAVRNSMQKLKQEVIANYGGYCVCCGEFRIEFLSIDHIFNDGAQQRRDQKIPTGRGFYRWLKNNGFPQGRLQILCFNCNGAKGYYGICPHELDAKRLMRIAVEIPEIRRPKLGKTAA